MARMTLLLLGLLTSCAYAAPPQSIYCMGAQLDDTTKLMVTYSPAEKRMYVNGDIHPVAYTKRLSDGTGVIYTVPYLSEDAANVYLALFAVNGGVDSGMYLALVDASKNRLMAISDLDCHRIRASSW